ncbi:MAG: hypothetical protein ACREEE_00550 [Dongiaceae bacterium]
MVNAKRQGRDDVWREAFRRLCELEGTGHATPLDREFYKMLTAYEELLSEKNGRRTAAARTRQKLKNKGVMRCLEDWSRSPVTTQGFELLVKHGLAELTAEHIVAKHPEFFSVDVVAGAKAKLAKYGVTVN